MKKVPMLRFPGFSGEWEEKRLGEVAEIKRGAASQHLNYVNDPNKGIRLLRINDFINDEAVYIEDTDDIKRFRVKTNDLLIAGTGATAGIIFIVPEKFNNLAYSYNAPRIRVESAHYGYIYFYLKSDITLKQQQQLFVGNAQPFLDTDSIRSFKINLPALPEQQKIADFLSAVDARLQALKKKKALLEQYKKGVMQQIFAQEIRFKGDDGRGFPDWEEKKLGEIAKFSKGKGISKNDISENGKIPCIRYGELYTRYNEVISLAHSKTDVNEKDLVFSEANDVIIPASGETQIDIAKASCVIKPGIALGGDLNIIKTGNNGVFLSYYLNNKKKLEIANLAQGISVVHLYASQLSQLTLEIPSLPEQQKIADFLTSLDEKISRCSAQVAGTELWKKGLLQGLFV